MNLYEKIEKFDDELNDSEDVEFTSSQYRFLENLANGNGLTDLQRNDLALALEIRGIDIRKIK